MSEIDKYSNRFGVFYVVDGTKYFHKSFPNMESIEFFIENDKEFEAIKKDKIIIIELVKS